MEGAYCMSSTALLSARPLTSASFLQDELRPLLFPTFVHTYLKLLSTSFPLLARSFYVANAPAHHAMHAATLSTLAGLTSAAHIAASPVARRFREEKYVVRMSKGGFSLLCGWLGGGGVEGNWEEGASKARGKEAVRSLINEHIRVDGASSLRPWRASVSAGADMSPARHRQSLSRRSRSRRSSS
jgi:transcription initiation factor TFIID subunit 5